MDDGSTKSSIGEASPSSSLHASISAPRVTKEEQEEEEEEEGKEKEKEKVEAIGPVPSKIAIKSTPRKVESPSHDSLQIREITIDCPHPAADGHHTTTPVLDRQACILRDGYTFNWIESHTDFQRLVEHCQLAMDKSVVPDRIGKGSSGSYFIKDIDNNIVGVFKPKDEEPYGQLNPRWIKWLHRHCCPCLFGRSFLMPNTGYISETAASLVDSFLGLNVVPRTHIAHLSSSAFVFPWWEHYRMWREHAQNPAARYPLKLGSFQLFVQGFEDAKTVLDRLNQIRPLEPQLREAFQAEFEKMTILDYAIRNTDRSLDNWLIHMTWADEPEGDDAPLPTTSVSAMQSTVQVDSAPTAAVLHAKSDTHLTPSSTRLKPRVKIACIDNGLAFPFKHPHELRSYPYSWTNLPEAAVPYSPALRKQLLPLLTDTANWDLLIGRLRMVFQIDADFCEEIFQRQMAVLRGQLHNIVEALLQGESPAQLLQRPLLLIHADGEEEAPRHLGGASGSGGGGGKRKHRQMQVKDRPLFTCW